MRVVVLVALALAVADPERIFDRGGCGSCAPDPKNPTRMQRPAEGEVPMYDAGDGDAGSGPAISL
jgi:hypothetical protein